MNINIISSFITEIKPIQEISNFINIFKQIRILNLKLRENMKDRQAQLSAIIDFTTAIGYSTEEEQENDNDNGE